MGAFLQKPDTQKHSSQGKSAQLSYGVTHMKGWRKTMEDATITKTEGLRNNVSFFGVYDGHGGCEVAKYVENNLINLVQDLDAFKKKNFKIAFEDVYRKLDQQLKTSNLEKYSTEDNSSYGRGPEALYEHCGTTACSAIITADEIICGNLGDSRCVLAVEKNGKIVAEDMSYDHKPENDEETRRIEGADGFVDDGRVEGTLAVSRALGDHIFKKREDLGYQEQMVSAFPEVKFRKLTKDCKFMIIACDGIWDCLSSQQCVDLINKHLTTRQKETAVLEFMFDEIIAKDIATSDGTGTDNMSAILIRFNHQQD